MTDEPVTADLTVTAYVPRPVAIALVESRGWRVEHVRGGNCYVAPGRPLRSEGGSFKSGDYVWSLQDALERTIAECADEPRTPEDERAAQIAADMGCGLAHASEIAEAEAAGAEPITEADDDVLVDGHTAQGVHVLVVKGTDYDHGDYANVVVTVNGVVRSVIDSLRARDGGTTHYTLDGGGAVTLPNNASDDDRTPRLNGDPIR
jgi:hypothetical protein